MSALNFRGPRTEPDVSEQLLTQAGIREMARRAVELQLRAIGVYDLIGVQGVTQVMVERTRDRLAETVYRAIEDRFATHAAVDARIINETAGQTVDAFARNPQTLKLDKN